MVFPWPQPAMFAPLDSDEASLDPEDPARFENPATYHNGSIKELHSYLKDDNLSKLASELGVFKKEVSG